MAETMTPFSFGIPLSGASTMLDSSTLGGQALIEQMVMRQAAIISYSNDYLLMCVVTLIALPLVLLLRKPRAASSTPAPAIHAD
jgi:DHA2 family multidrug resistance protein